MNLAEIRKKARLSQPVVEAPVSRTGTGVVHPGPGERADCSAAEPLSSRADAAAGAGAAEDHCRPGGADARPADMDPLAVLLAGRQSAGLTMVGETEDQDEHESTVHKYLRFRIAAEEYGLSLLEIREIIKTRPVTQVPRMPKFVIGVISLRGIIVPVIDLRQRLGFPSVRQTGLERIIVVRKGDSSCGLLVDEVCQVISLAESAIDKAPPVFEGVTRDFVMALGQRDGLVVTLLALEHLLDVNCG